MNKYLLAFSIIILIFVVNILIFATIYYNVKENDTTPYVRTWTDSLYVAITIQTNVGLANSPLYEGNAIRNWIMVQSILSYLITFAGIFILSKIMFEKV
jgi:heme A synthase